MKFYLMFLMFRPVLEQMWLLMDLPWTYIHLKSSWEITKAETLRLSDSGFLLGDFFGGSGWTEYLTRCFLLLSQRLTRKRFLHVSCQWMHTERVKCHFDDIIITGCTGICQNDNFRCNEWLKKIRQNDDISVFSALKATSYCQGHPHLNLSTLGSVIIQLHT